ncbi:flagellar basal-body rod protein FlgG [Spectribacter hydrogenoxidans]|uniref:Flagellar basal-body rod protein FlgG n=1 Tax=Spectribacter hydrogenoxidans TaxID=3075608 RepID=A0ABU3BVS7_9GAMM|nr:flagellar basal-body rod protein FlgG [Salinisphaera sp. W335]MDT0633399.1 flagellar basal-body rod protein FlgG [Salinisphaera sp. W335]
MDSSLWVAKTGLDAQQTRMTVISNNLANVNTTAFKKGRAAFEDLLYQNIRQAGAQVTQNSEDPTGLSLGTGVRVLATEKLYAQGNVVQTENSLDVAIDGRGFFQVLQADGTTAFTRDGSFRVDSQGQLVTAAGLALEPGITVPQGAQSISIGQDGTVSVQLPGQAAAQQIGALQLVDFVNPAGLQARGQNLLIETGASGPATPGTPGLNGLGSLNQGALESSNVNVVEELVNMIETQRAYEMNSRAISTVDDMLAYLSNNL